MLHVASLFYARIAKAEKEICELKFIFDVSQLYEDCLIKISIKRKKMLQKLENAYLAILRMAIIATAGGLLIAVVIFGLNALSALQSEPKQSSIQPAVTTDSMVEAITTDYSLKEPVNKVDDHSIDEKTKKDPNTEYYNRAVAAVAKYIDKVNSLDENNDYSMDKDEFYGYVKKRTETYNESGLAEVFSKGLAENLEKSLTTTAVINESKKKDLKDIINLAINGYTLLFDKQVEQENKKFLIKHQEYLDNKVNSMQSLYVAGGALVAFLIIVFLSVIIKIERNLRPENR